MKKKILTLLVAVLLCLTAFVGCDKNETTDTAFGISANGKSFSLGDSVDTLVGAMGEPLSVAEAGSCAGQGTLKEYTYNSMTVHVLENDKGATVDYVSLTNDLVTTSKGIRIGSTKADVVEAYGEPNNDNGTNIQYVSGEFAIKFGIANDKVNAITLIRTT